jgi:hypothetical protein
MSATTGRSRRVDAGGGHYALGRGSTRPSSGTNTTVSRPRQPRRRRTPQRPPRAAGRRVVGHRALRAKDTGCCGGVVVMEMVDDWRTHSDAGHSVLMLATDRTRDSCRRAAVLVREVSSAPVRAEAGVHARVRRSADRHERGARWEAPARVSWKGSREARGRALSGPCRGSSRQGRARVRRAPRLPARAPRRAVAATRRRRPRRAWAR